MNLTKIQEKTLQICIVLASFAFELAGATPKHFKTPFGVDIDVRDIYTHIKVTSERKYFIDIFSASQDNK